MACLCRQPVASTSKRIISTSRRGFATSSRLCDQRGSSGKSYAQGVRSFDPDNLLEQQNQIALLHDDLPTRAFREFDRDAERLHYRRLIEWQLPELGEKYGQKEPWKRPASHVIKTRKREWAFEPDHDQSSTALLSVPVAKCLERLKSEASRHKFLLLLGDRYKVEPGVVLIRGDRFPAYAQNLKWCSDQLDEVLKEAEVEPDRFAEVPISPGGQRKHRLSIRDFPKDWLGEPMPRPAREIEPALRELQELGKGVQATA